MLIRPPSSGHLWNRRMRHLQLSYQLKRWCKEENTTISFLLFLLPLYPQKNCLTIFQTLIPANNINKNTSEVEKGVWNFSPEERHQVQVQITFCIGNVCSALMVFTGPMKQSREKEQSWANPTRGLPIGFFFFSFTQSWIWSIFFYLL